MTIDTIITRFKRAKNFFGRLFKEWPKISALKKFAVRETEKLKKKITIIDTTNQIAFIQDVILKAGFVNITRKTSVDKIDLKNTDIVLYAYDNEKISKKIVDTIEKSEKEIYMITYHPVHVDDKYLSKFQSEHMHTYCNNPVNALSYIDLLASINS